MVLPAGAHETGTAKGRHARRTVRFQTQGRQQRGMHRRSVLRADFQRILQVGLKVFLFNQQFHYEYYIKHRCTRTLLERSLSCSNCLSAIYCNVLYTSYIRYSQITTAAYIVAQGRQLDWKRQMNNIFENLNFKNITDKSGKTLPSKTRFRICMSFV